MLNLAYSGRENQESVDNNKGAKAACLDRDVEKGPAEIPRGGQGRDGLWIVPGADGEKHPTAKPLKGFGGAKVLEIVDGYERNTYRTVYTLLFAGTVYVLHAFQKKAKKGIATPKPEIELIRRRLKRAREHHETQAGANYE